MFARDLKWDDDYTLEKSTDNRRGLLQLAMYAMHLATGNTLFCKTIKAATVKKYIQAAATFLSLFGDTPRDYRRDNPSDAKLSPILSSVFAEMERWEDQPNRREPYTLEMLADLKNSTAFTAQGNDSLWAATADWFECGLFAGLRLSEWAQESGSGKMGSYQRDFKHQARAFTLGDIRFEDNKRSRFTAKQVLETNADATITKCWIKFRTQKNGQNGEERLFARNTDGKCFVQAMLRIVRRFARLRGLNDNATPLALYMPAGEKEPRFITSLEIETIMRANAARVYNLDPVKDTTALQRWSAHSLRVGACVILHVMGWTDTQIQWILRWRSNAFMVYLRNVAIMSTMQNHTLDKAAAMPHFF